MSNATSPKKNHSGNELQERRSLAEKKTGSENRRPLPDPANPGRMPGQMSNGMMIQDLLTDEQNAALSNAVLARQNATMEEAKKLGASDDLLNKLSTGELKSWIEGRKAKDKLTWMENQRAKLHRSGQKKKQVEKHYVMETFLQLIDARGLEYRKPACNKRMKMFDTVKVPVVRLKWNTDTMPGDTEDLLDDYIRRKRHYITGKAKQRRGPVEVIEMKIVDLQPEYPRGLQVAPTELLNRPRCQFTVDTFEVMLHDVESNKKEAFQNIAKREWKWHHQEKSNGCNYQARFLPAVVGRVARAYRRKLTDTEVKRVEDVRQELEEEFENGKPTPKKRKMSDDPIEKEQKELNELDEKYHLKSIDPGKYNRHALAVLMLMWARIAGISKWTKDEATHTEDPVLYSKYIDLTLCFGMDEEEICTVQRMADDRMDGQPYRLLEIMGRSILDRLKQFHIEYMNITEEATHKIMEQYRLFFDRTKKYEMKIWTRLQELSLIHI